MAKNKKIESNLDENDLDNIDYDNPIGEDGLNYSPKGSKGGQAVRNYEETDFVNDQDVINDNPDFREDKGKNVKRSYRK